MAENRAKAFPGLAKAMARQWGVFVMDDIKLAAFGNKEAAKRLTAAGVLLPCPGCGGENAKHRAVMACEMIECPCGFMAAGYGLEEARRIWNTRAPILSEEEVEMLHGKENP